MYNIPKNSKLEVRCCQEENGPVTHLIVSKVVGMNKKFYLYQINGDELLQIGVAENPYDLYDKIRSD